jgi:hypothetical protein
MNANGPAFFLLIAGGLLLAGCTSYEVGPDRTHTRDEQLETFEALPTLEAQVVAFAELQPDVVRARAFIRPQAAVILLEPTGGSTISPETVNAINAFLERTAGLRKDQIVMKPKGAH